MAIAAFTKQHIFLGKEFREVPGYIGLAASIDGEVLRLTEQGEPHSLSPQYKMHNVKVGRRDNSTFYLTVRLRDKTLSKRSTGVHILVCLAWNGPPPDDGARYDVNHIDSVKINNHADNLEWLTRSQNISHCFDSGQNSAAIRIIEKDENTGEEKIYRSIKNFAETMGLHRVDVRKFVAKHSVIAHNGRTYRIEQPREARIKPIKYQIRNVAFKDYSTGELMLANSIEEASQMTGIGSGTIKSACERFERKGKVRPLLNYFFQFLKADMTWPVFSNAALADYEEQFKRRSAATSGPRK